MATPDGRRSLPLHDALQERLQQKRVPFDNWSVREQLCLASAVLCSGDQNWMSVSRALKILCDPKRPADWFSQKSCAAQYDKLLSGVETPKRKKRTASERDSAIPVETPNESVVKRLTQERIAELKKIMLEEQQQFLKLKEEILVLQNPNMTEAQLKEICAAIDEEQKQKEAEKEKHDLWLKQREERKKEHDRAWRPGLAAYRAQQAQKASTPVAVVKSEVEGEQLEQQTQQKSSGQSPLLTSLLKSPSATTSIASVPSTPTTTNRIGSAQVNLTQMMDSYQSPSEPKLTASQVAPTLSMLLDTKNSSSKNANKSSTTTNADDSTIDITADIFPEQIPSIESCENDGGDDVKDDDLLEAIKGLIPEELINEEFSNILHETNIPDLLEEEEILGKADELDDDADADDDEVEEIVEPEVAPAVNNPVPMDTFDQLKNESIAEEKKKRDAEAAAAQLQQQQQQQSQQQQQNQQMEVEAEPVTIEEINISPEDSNQEDDIPLKVIQKDIQEAKAASAKEETQEKEIVIEDPGTPNSDTDLFPEKTEVITDETSSTDPSEPIEIKQEEEVDDCTEANETRELEEKLSRESDEEIFEDAKDELPENNPPITIPTDTDDDSSSQIKPSSSKRRKCTETEQIKSEDSDSRSSSMVAIRTRSKEHERSESPIDDDSDNTPRRTRRFSSTPVIDSIPNSPVPEDKAWRKLILLALGRISAHKNAAIFQHFTKEDVEKRYKGVFLRPIDLPTIKKYIETGAIRTTSEFQRDIMLLCTNIMMSVPIKSQTYQQAHEMMHESVAIIKSTMEKQQEKDPIITSSTEKLAEKSTPGTAKRGSRKSQRIS